MSFVASLLPYASAVLHALDASFAFQVQLGDGFVLSHSLHAGAELISLLAISHAIISTVGDKGAEKAMTYAVVLTLLAYFVPKYLLRRVLSALCGGCPSNGLVSMALVALVVCFVLERVVVREHLL